MNRTRSVVRPTYSPQKRVALNRCYLAECERDLDTRHVHTDFVVVHYVSESRLKFCDGKCLYEWLTKHEEERS